MKITQEELIEMICEGVNKKIDSLISGNIKKTLSETEMITMVEEVLQEWMFVNDDNVYGSDKFEYDREYQAIDTETLEDELRRHGYFYSDLEVMMKPSGQKILRFELDFDSRRDVNERELLKCIQRRAMYSDGIKMLKGGNGYPILLVYCYKN